MKGRVSTEAQDVYGRRIRVTREGVTYGEQFVPLDEMDDMQPVPHTVWSPATNLFEIRVVRRNRRDLVIKNLLLQTADLLREAIIDALRGRYT